MGSAKNACCFVSLMKKFENVVFSMLFKFGEARQPKFKPLSSEAAKAATSSSEMVLVPSLQMKNSSQNICA